MKKFEKKSRIYYILFIVFAVGVLFYKNSISGFAMIKSIQDCKVTMPYSSVAYTGEKIIPNLTIVDGKKTLVKGRDYVIAVKNNVKLGKASVTIRGVQKYKGMTTKHFNIVRKNIAECDITLKEEQYIYTGSAFTPKVLVKNGKKIITQNKSYSVVYQDNKKIGLATIIITGKGNFTGVATKTFQIVPPDVANLCATSNASGTSIALKWDKIEDVSGYYIYQYDAVVDKYKYISTASATATTHIITKLTPGTEYSFVVKAYKKSKNITMVSQGDTAVTKVTIVPSVSDFTSPNSNYNCIYLSWKKINKVSGYVIYLYDAVTNQYNKVKTVTWNTDNCNVKELQANTKYIMAIRAYHKDHGKTYYSSSYTRVTAQTCKSYSKKTMYVDGDSIAYGTGAGGYSFADALSKKYGMQLTKKATPGALISTSYAEKSHIVESIKMNFIKPYDYVLLDGGVNDYLRSSKIGTIGTKDITTTIGALETIFEQIDKVSPHAQIYFILPHKPYDTITYGNMVTSKNRQGATYADYRRAIVDLIKTTSGKYSVKLIDCYRLIDATDEEERKTKTADQDGIHPTKNVQINLYTPFIASRMGL